MRSRAAFGVILLAVAAGALVFRLPRLTERPMHGDEAVQAVKAGILAETGVYRYDPHQFHGPTLYYLTLPSLWYSAGGRLADATEATFRIVPVLFGTGLVLLLLLVGDGLGRVEAACAGVLTAVSPAMVFYSRFYIQEMLLVFLTFAAIAAGWRYTRSRRLGWALLTGLCLGLMHATKETCVIAHASMLGALVLLFAWDRGEGWDIRGRLPLKRLVGAVLVGGAASAVLFSSFLTHWAGPLDSIRAYADYFDRAGKDPLHLHPWHYYLKTLLYVKQAPGPWWSEGLIVALALGGIVAAFAGRRRPLVRFLAVYTALMTVAYSIIPYKTPWCALGFLHGMILLAGVGAVALVRWTPSLPAKAIVCLALAVASANLAGQAYRGSFKFYADNRNPYVYAHPVMDVVRLAKRVEEIARTHPDGRDMVVKVIAPGSDYWPLPWYLRRLRCVGYWNDLPDDADAPVVIAAAPMQTALEQRLRKVYQTSYFGLRPQVPLALYVQEDLWKEFLRSETQLRDGQMPNSTRSINH